jgi:hypothetical protein
MGASICWAAAETDTQSTIFDSSALPGAKIFPVLFIVVGAVQ